MSVLPSGWQLAHLADVTHLPDAVDWPTWLSPTFVYIDISSIDNRTAAIAFPKLLHPDDAPARARQLVREGDTIFSTVRTHLRNIGYVDSHLDGQIASTGFSVLRPRGGMAPRYIYYYCQSSAFVRKISAEQRGVSYPAVTDRQVRAMSIPVPPREEQERIVSAIDEQFSRLDAGVAALESARQKLKRMRAAILRAAVAGHLLSEGNPSAPPGTMPDEWSMQPLEELIHSLRNGIFVSRPVVEPVGPPILRISAVRPLALNVEDVRHVPPSAPLTRAKNFTLTEGDLLFTRYSGNPEYVGACAVVPPGAPSLLYPDKLIRVQVNTNLVDPRFMALAATAGATRQEIRRRVKTTAGQTGISGSDLRGVPFPVPPLDIQGRIADLAYEMLSVANRLEVDLMSALTRSRSLRASVLAAAFSGKLVAQDPIDEPAPVLLERMAADSARSSARSRPAAPRPRTPLRRVSA